jgi:hypothetical protein
MYILLGIYIASVIINFVLLLYAVLDDDGLPVDHPWFLLFGIVILSAFGFFLWFALIAHDIRVYLTFRRLHRLIDKYPPK